MANDETYTTLRDFVTELLEAGLDGRTIDRIIGLMARDRWQVARDAIVTGSPDLRPNPLAFAGQLHEHCDRAHGLCAAMAGAREALGEEACILGAQQIALDLSGSAQSLRRSFDALLLDLDRSHGA